MLQNRVSAAVENKVGAPSPDGSNGRKAPSRNGSNGRMRPSQASPPHMAPENGEATEAPASEGRAANGRFVNGNVGGPGNPFARRVAELRQAALAAVTPEDIHAIISKMTQMAREGNVPAAKLVLAYTIGKPGPAPEPDRLDAEEWKHFKEQAPIIDEAEGLLKPDLSMVLPCVRAGRQAMTWDYADLMRAALPASRE